MESSHPVIYSPKAEAGLSCNMEPETYSKFLIWAAGTQLLEPSLSQSEHWQEVEFGDGAGTNPCKHPNRHL